MTDSNKSMGEDGPEAYDVCLSFAGEDRAYVEAVAAALKSRGVRVFYDEYEPAVLWGKNLYEHLDHVYRKAAKYCILFISAAYAEKLWTNHERRSAQARAFKESAEYILPARFDDTEIPGLPATIGYIDLTKTSPAQLADLLVEKLSGGARAALVEPRFSACPYRGLSAFREEDAPYFFGREDLTDQLIKRVNGKPFVALIGSSGSGKSSVIFAGLVPRLRAQGSLVIASFRPGERPFHGLAAALIPLLEEGISETSRMTETTRLEKALEGRTISLRDVSKRILEKKGADCLVLIGDQFEELYAPSPGLNAGDGFIDCLLEALPNPLSRNSDLKLVVTLRADFLGHALSHRPLADIMQDADVKLGPMKRQELQAAIQKPGDLLGVRFEDGLVARMLDAVSGEPGALPLLEFALTLLWAHQSAGVMTHAAYEELGGVEGALAGHAEELYARFNPEQQSLVRRILLQLVQVGEGTQDTRRRVTEREVGATLKDDDGLASVIESLISARLLTSNRDDKSGDLWIEISHEALINGWPRLRAWLEEDRSNLRARLRLSDAAQEWERRGRDEALLYRGSRLREALAWREGSSVYLSELDHEFLETSLRAQNLQERAERSMRKRLQFLVWGLFVAFSVAGGVAFMAFQQKSNALEQERIAFSRELAASAIANLSIDPELSLLLARQAARTAATSQAQNALRKSLIASHVRVTLDQELGAESAVLSPSGKYVATIGYSAPAGQGPVTLWNTATGDEIVRLPGTAPFGRAPPSFSSHDRLLATPWNGTGVKIWRLPEGQLVTQLDRGHSVSGFAFSPVGRTLLVSEGRSAVIWNLDNNELIAELTHTDDRFSGQAFFRPDGRVVTVGTRHVLIWELSTGKTVRTIRDAVPRGRFVGGAALSPSGELLATWKENGEVIRVWRTTDGSMAAQFNDGVNDATFTPDGQFLLTASNSFGSDFTARIWSIERQRQVATVRHRGEVWSIDTSPDGSLMMTGSADGTARVWRVPSGKSVAELLGHGVPLQEVSFGSGGELMTRDEFGGVRLWDAGLPDGRAVLTASFRSLVEAAISANNELIVIPGERETALIANLSTGEIVSELRGHEDTVYRAEFNADGKQVVTASRDGTARVWETTTGQPVAELRGHSADVLLARFSPDGNLVVTSSLDGTARVWSAKSGQLVAELRDSNQDVASGDPAVGGDDRGSGAAAPDSCQGSRPRAHGRVRAIFDAAFSPNGEFLVTVSDRGNASIWRTESWQLVGKVLVADADVTFSPASDFLVSAGLYASGARIWDTDTLECVFGRDQVTGAADISPDGDLVATAATATQVWDTNSRRIIVQYRGHREPVSMAAFSSDAKFVVTASDDDTARVWRPRTGETVATLPHRTEVLGAVFSPNGRFVLTSAYDGAVRVWDAMSGEVVFKLNPPGLGLAGIATFTPDGRHLLTPAGRVATMYSCEVCLPLADLVKLANSRVTRGLTNSERELYLHDV